MLGDEAVVSARGDPKMHLAENEIKIALADGVHPLAAIIRSGLQ
jgi:hypothetical protein